MSKKNKLSTRKKQHEYDLENERKAKEKTSKKKEKMDNKMKVDKKSGIQKRKLSAGFKVGSKRTKTKGVKPTPLTKAKAAKAMEIDS